MGHIMSYIPSFTATIICPVFIVINMPSSGRTSQRHKSSSDFEDEPTAKRQGKREIDENESSTDATSDSEDESESGSEITSDVEGVPPHISNADSTTCAATMPSSRTMAASIEKRRLRTSEL
ncbi:hypothetical protein CPC08DRAFT_318265 [Agrocybe pediades]|nr:hypothetical protein CPC08DRAFT_318265 [Agrocybe pediades]